jgi:hypothetical protein
MSLYATITTIQSPTSCSTSLSEHLVAHGGRLVVAGDTKGPSSYPLRNTKFLSYDEQLASGFFLSKHLPVNHYARKNLAYLHAIKEGATCIYETDDDNMPDESWHVREEFLVDIECVSKGKRWINVYRYFSDELIWPRGLPLAEIHTTPPPLTRICSPIRAPIQQGLVNKSPDVDAIWRLVLNRPFRFEKTPGGKSILLSAGNWCPFNTQSTWWWPVAYPLLYIPSYCSFRMCDIWKSLVAQRCLWALDMGVVFHPPEVVQERNLHDLHKDFTDEVSGYLNNTRIREILDELILDAGGLSINENLHRCYQSLISNGLLPAKEMVLLEAWLSDISSLTDGSLIV